MFGISKEIRGKNIAYRPELDGIRALAIFVVLLHHLGYLNGRGFLGVDIFFTLSGYLITQLLLATFTKGKSIFTFYRRRISRLYPIMAISIIVATLVIGYQSSRDNKAIFASIFYYKNFLHWGDLFGPFWSLSAEEQFYLVFPITLILFLKFFNKKIFLLFLISVISAVWGYTLWVNYPDYSWNQDGVFNLAVFRPSMILVGCVISLDYNLICYFVGKIRILATFIFSALVVLSIHLQFPGLAALATAILIVLLDRRVARRSRLSRFARSILSFSPVKVLGVLSYSIYIWHMPVIFYYYGHGHNPHLHVAQVLAIVLSIAIISFYLVEVPLQSLLSRNRKGPTSDKDGKLENLQISISDPRDNAMKSLLQSHLDFCMSVTPAESVFALNVEKLLSSDITVFGAWRNGKLLGVGALRKLDAQHGELKSMHTAKESRGSGVGKALVAHILNYAKEFGLTRVSLETGNYEEFAPARELYRSIGFEECAVFGDYPESSISVCMTKYL